MYANLYHHTAQQQAADTAQTIIAELYRAYSNDMSLLPADWQISAPECEPQRSRHIADFLAGMTDRYAQNCHRDIFGKTQ
jgi:dGTPase